MQSVALAGALPANTCDSCVNKKKVGTCNSISIVLYKMEHGYISNSTTCGGFLGFHQSLEKTPLMYSKILKKKKKFGRV